MRSFIYFLPNYQAGLPTPEVIGRHGLEYALAGRDATGAALEFPGVIEGAPNGSGTLVTLKGADHEMDAARGREGVLWQEADGGRYWVGAVRDRMPGPEDLARGDALGGQLVRMGDGQQWSVPVAHPCRGCGSVPLSYGVNADGTPRVAHAPGYDTLLADANAAYEVITGAVAHGTEGESSVVLRDDIDYIRLCSRVLAWNYRLSVWEVSLLKLLTSVSIMQILEALVDAAGMKAILAGKAEGS